MITPGKLTVLKVGQPTEGGVLLIDAGQGAVMLPHTEYEKAPESGSYVTVFVYQNNLGVLTATLKRPLLMLGEAACLTIRSVTEAGAFAEWGIGKDIFISFKEQKVHMEEGEQYVITLYWDETSERLAGSSRLTKHLDNAEHELEEGMEVDVLIADRSDLGINVVINRKYLGLVYHNEFFSTAGYGDTVKGWIKALRPNNKIDVSLQKPGYEAVDEGAEQLLTILEKSKGFLPLTDKSDPMQINNMLGMSKKVFKKAIGQLYRQRVISLHEDGIRLTDSE